MCVLKIAHFKTNRGGMKFTTTASLKIIPSLRSKAEKKKKSQKHLEEAKVPEHDFNYFGKAAASL